MKIYSAHNRYNQVEQDNYFNNELICRVASNCPAAKREGGN